MEHSLFRLVKKTGTYADALAALGLAQILYHLTGQAVQVSDEGAYYGVRLERPIQLDALDTEILRANPAYPYMKLNPEDPDAPNGCIDFQMEWQRVLAYAEMVKEKTASIDAEQIKNLEPRQDWSLISNVDKLKGFKSGKDQTSYNRLHVFIRHAEPEAFHQSIVAKLAVLTADNDVATVETSFSPKVSSLQAFNPVAGKGINRIKPDGVSAASLPEPFTDWFEEWLRYIGIHFASNGFSVGKEGKDIKLVTLVPADIEVTFVREVIGPSFRKFRLDGGSIRIDIFCALEVAEELIRRSGMLQGQMRGFLYRRTPRGIIAGLQSAYFSKTNQFAHAVMNTSFIGLPGWFPVNSREDAEVWMEIIDEHRACLRLLKEEKSEEAALLQRYRNFLSGNSLGDLLDFLAGYGAHLIRNRERGRPVAQFTTTNLRRLMERMERKLAPILENVGFRNVAEAIRRATVIEQYMKAKRQDVFEIHYGLVPDLRRKARFRDQFVAALCDFVDHYNRENARRAEQLKGEPGRRRPSVTTNDIEEVVRLIDEHGSEVVAMLLIAYGTAREPGEKEVEAQAVGA